MLDLFKKKKQVIFTILEENIDGKGFMIGVKFKGDVIDAHVLGIKQYIDNQVNLIVQARKHEKKKGKKNG